MQNHLLYTEFLFIKQRLIRLYLSNTLVFCHITTKPVTHSSAPARLLVPVTSLRAVPERKTWGQPTQNKATSYLADTNNKEAQLPLGRGKKQEPKTIKMIRLQTGKLNTKWLKDSLQHKTKADTVNRWWKQQGQNRQSFRWEPKTGSKTKRKLIHQSKTGSNQNILVKEGTKN